MLQIYEKRADNVVQKRVFLIFLGLLLMQTLAFAQSDSKITIQQKDITVVDALKTVERQSKMSINYSDSELKGKKIADLNLEDVSVKLGVPCENITITNCTMLSGHGGVVIGSYFIIKTNDFIMRFYNRFFSIRINIIIRENTWLEYGTIIHKQQSGIGQFAVRSY